MSFWGGSKAVPPPPQPPPPIPRSSPEIDGTTVLSLLFFVSLLGAAYGASIRLLPPTSTVKTRILFVWHLFDALIHLFFEGSFLWNCFFVSYSLPTSFNAAAKRHPRIKLLTPPDVYWLGREDRIYGANYGEGMFSRLWQEYAKADRRWGGTDLGVVSLEVLTVFVGAPLACKFRSPLAGKKIFQTPQTFNPLNCQTAKRYPDIFPLQCGYACFFAAKTARARSSAGSG